MQIQRFSGRARRGRNILRSTDAGACRNFCRTRTFQQPQELSKFRKKVYDDAGTFWRDITFEQDYSIFHDYWLCDFRQTEKVGLHPHLKWTAKRKYRNVHIQSPLFTTEAWKYLVSRDKMCIVYKTDQNQKCMFWLYTCVLRIFSDCRNFQRNCWKFELQNEY